MLLKVQLQCTIEVNLILFADTISGREESRTSWWFYDREKDMAVLCSWLTDVSAVIGKAFRKSWAHGPCKCVWFCCRLDFCCCTLFWNSPTSLCSALFNYEVLWPSDRISGWDDMTMKWDIFRAFQPKGKTLDNIENINIWGRNFQQKITRPKAFFWRDWYKQEIQYFSLKEKHVFLRSRGVGLLSLLYSFQEM